MEGMRVFCVATEHVEHLPYYFPRNGNELKASHKQLPSNLGNEWGELILNERTIRIGSLPKGRHDVDYIKKRKVYAFLFLCICLNN